MIEVTRLNGQPMLLNPDMILSLEATPDTVISLTTGEKCVVTDSIDILRERFLLYKRSIHLRDAL
jgi:flagellar protein FlbD